MDRTEVKLLIVDDDDVDVMAIERGFRQAKIANQLIRAKDGIEALAILRGEQGRQPLEKPHVILLDLNMPRMDGFGFLKELREDPKLHQAIVFILTTSKAEEDRVHAYDLNVAGYIVKSQAGKDFLDLVNMIDHYWKIVQLPIQGAYND